MKWKFFFLAVLSLTTYSANAFTLNGKVTNGKVTWDNLVVSQGQNSLSTWTPQSGLRTTTKWRPGFLAAPQPLSSITLSGSGEIVSFPLEIIGIEYNVGSNPLDSTIATPPVMPCDVNSVSGNTIHLVGQWDCSYEKLINNGASKTPFFFLRPLFNINSGDVIEAFKGKADGSYSGTIPFTLRYFYYSDSGALTYRDIPQSFSIQLYHKPSYISTLTLFGNGVIPPVYDTVAKTVSGKTSYDVKATGYFERGMRMLLDNRNYVLTSQTVDKVIPYSIKCIGAPCSDNLLVSAGTLQKDVILLNSVGDRTAIDFKLEFTYENISATSVDTARYSDNFTVLFEVEL